MGGRHKDSIVVQYVQVVYANVLHVLRARKNLFCFEKIAAIYSFPKFIKVFPLNKKCFGKGGPGKVQLHLQSSRTGRPGDLQDENLTPFCKQSVTKICRDLIW